MLLDAFAADLEQPCVWSEKFGSLFATMRVAQENLFLCKPQRYMNRSGESVQEICNFHKIAADEVVCLHDDLDLPFAKIRIKQGGGAGGHNGVSSLIECLGSQEFVRVKLGIGRPAPEIPVENPDDVVSRWVLGSFSQDQKPELPAVMRRGVEGIKALLSSGIKTAQNLYN